MSRQANLKKILCISLIRHFSEFPYSLTTLLKDVRLSWPKTCSQVSQLTSDWGFDYGFDSYRSTVRFHRSVFIFQPLWMPMDWIHTGLHSASNPCWFADKMIHNCEGRRLRPWCSPFAPICYRIKIISVFFSFNVHIWCITCVAPM